MRQKFNLRFQILNAFATLIAIKYSTKYKMYFNVEQRKPIDYEIFIIDLIVVDYCNYIV